ncbi:protein required for attachment to host cells [Rhodovulum steppense]|uniref:Protein required for attachment to host cells n=2 Tax=Rhodovulum steppense TaxID=540251 RepID=A0A4R1YK92_9RHOB|nr:protein required for attachment to host cells [Rhodovulum steppense]
MGSVRVWGLAMTATRARILRGLSVPGAGGLATELVMRARHRHLIEAMQHPPVDAGAAAPIPPPVPEGSSDPLALDQRDFVRQVVQILETHRVAGDFDRLAIFAPPAILAQLRAEMPSRLAKVIAAERSGCAIHLSETELQDVLRAELATLKA